MAAVDSLFSIFSTIGTILFWGWPWMLLIGIFIIRSIWRKWPIDAVIIEKRGDNLIKTNDRCGRFTDPYTGIMGYKLNKSKDTLPIVNYNWVLHNVSVPTNLLERFVNLLRGNVGTIFLFRYGSKQYKPINIKANGKIKKIFKEIKDKSGNSTYIKIYQQFDPRDKMGALTFEVIDWDNMNFMVQEQRASIVRRAKKGEFLKTVLIPLGILVVSALVCIMMFKFSYDWAVSMRSQVAPASTPSSTPTPDIPIISDLIPAPGG